MGYRKILGSSTYAIAQTLDSSVKTLKTTPETALPKSASTTSNIHLAGRLRAAGVSFEDRQDLLGHTSGRMTTHYSAAELTRLIEAANQVCETDGTRPELVVLRGVIHTPSRKISASANLKLREIG